MAEAENTAAETPTLSEPELIAEAARGRLAAFVALFAVLTIFGTIALYVVAWNGMPADVSNAAFLTRVDEKSVAWTLSLAFRAISTGLLAIVFAHFILAVQARRSETPKQFIYLAIAGPLIAAFGYPLLAVAQIGAASDFAGAEARSAELAHDLVSGGFYQASGYICIAGLFLTAIAWVVTGVTTMRTGLLTRMMAGVAIAIGVFYAFTSVAVLQPPIILLVEMFWLGAVATMFLARRDARPPAWVLGRQVPWTEVQQVAREQADPAE